MEPPLSTTSASADQDPGFISSLRVLAMHYSDWLSGVQAIMDGKESAHSSQYDSLHSATYMAIKHAALKKSPFKFSSTDLNDQFTREQLRFLWKGIIQTVQVVDTLDPWQDKFLQLVMWTRQFDGMIKELNGVQDSDTPWEEYGFGEQLQHAWEKLMWENEVEKMSNLAAFSAKALTAGVSEQSLADTALWYFREAFESQDDDKVASLLSVTAGWYSGAAYKLLLLCVKEKNGGLEPGPKAREFGVEKKGFSMERWLFWRKRLQGLNHHADREVLELARKVFMLNVAAGRDTGFDVPGEKRFQERMDKAMVEALDKSGKECVTDTDIEMDFDWVDE
ncbi:hypothetical protein QBC44DRAFT_314564 [Cladorrhinum sp. PSN332]|nr:hypothetical protein QBC44DRAFT_314564 [Cladorrhinum sp. PSN332]